MGNRPDRSHEALEFSKQVKSSPAGPVLPPPSSSVRHKHTSNYQNVRSHFRLTVDGSDYSIVSLKRWAVNTLFCLPWLRSGGRAKLRGLMASCPLNWTTQQVPHPPETVASLSSSFYFPVSEQKEAKYTTLMVTCVFTLKMVHPSTVSLKRLAAFRLVLFKLRGSKCDHSVAAISIWQQ